MVTVIDGNLSLLENLEKAQGALRRVAAAINAEGPIVHEAHRPKRRCMGCVVVQIAQVVGVEMQAFQEGWAPADPPAGRDAEAR